MSVVQLDEYCPQLAIAQAHVHEPMLLTHENQFNMYWPLAEPLLERCVVGATEGEYTVDDLHRMVMENRANMFVCTSDRSTTDPELSINLAFIVEPVIYPQLNAVNILAIGGHNLRSQRKFWDYFKGWAFMNGASTIEASLSPAMMRILSSWGFRPVYTHARCDLTES